MNIRAMLAAFALVIGAAGDGCGRRPQGSETSAGPTESAPTDGASTEPASQTESPVPAEILAALPTCSISVTVYPQGADVDDPGPGLRNVSLYVPETLREPPGLWSDGTPVNADLGIDEDTARRLLEVLGAHGFFGRTARRHSEARPSPAAPPPPGSTAGLPERVAEPNVEITVRVHDEDWHSMRIASWPLDDEARMLLQELEQAAGGETGSALAQLRATF
ncbi:MAG: hypothetical protein HY907_16985 [Deltaproteobacteria bacterium]|nr:hypothetical protein [Deltaproteobacteria bacterium]